MHKKGSLNIGSGNCQKKKKWKLKQGNENSVFFLKKKMFLAQITQFDFFSKYMEKISMLDIVKHLVVVIIAENNRKFEK